MGYYIVGVAVILLFTGGICRTLRGKNKIVRVIEDNCSGCKRCLKRCSRRVLEMASDENGTHVIVAKPNKCDACGNCVSVCKFNALEIVKKSGKYEEKHK